MNKIDDGKNMSSFVALQMADHMPTNFCFSRQAAALIFIKPLVDFLSPKLKMLHPAFAEVAVTGLYEFLNVPEGCVFGNRYECYFIQVSFAAAGGFNDSLLYLM